ncbi:MAG: hypothetical protein H0W13_11310 [Nitrospirales bacterium]|nr:hypothetical protein [Nitrospirales bacterium]
MMKSPCSNWFLEYGWAERQRVVHLPCRVRLPRHSEKGSAPAPQPEQKKRLVEAVHLMKGQHDRRPAGTKLKARVWPSGMERIEGAALPQ